MTEVERFCGLPSCLSEQKRKFIRVLRNPSPRAGTFERHLEDELARNIESVDVAKSILDPVVRGARSQLGLGPGGLRCHLPKTKIVGKKSQPWDGDNRSQEDFQAESRGAGLRADELDKGRKEEVRHVAGRHDAFFSEPTACRNR